MVLRDLWSARQSRNGHFPFLGRHQLGKRRGPDRRVPTCSPAPPPSIAASGRAFHSRKKAGPGISGGGGGDLRHALQATKPGPSWRIQTGAFGAIRQYAGARRGGCFRVDRDRPGDEKFKVHLVATSWTLIGPMINSTNTPPIVSATTALEPGSLQGPRNVFGSVISSISRIGVMPADFKIDTAAAP